jgi:hypothetical protein
MRLEEIHGGLVARLRDRREEIERAVLTRVHGVSELDESVGVEYLAGLRAAVSAAIDHGLASLERSEANPPQTPAALLSQARLAARSGVSLDTVLRRYLAGYTVLGDFVIEEADKDGLRRGSSLQRLLRRQATLFDRLLAAVGDEYSREKCARLESPEQRRADRVERLLAGELVDTSDLPYEFDAHHLGLISSGQGAGDALARLAKALDRRLLLVQRDDGTTWAWLGGRGEPGAERLELTLAKEWPPHFSLALGEPGQGLAGWRLTHRQAQAALPIALRSKDTCVRYSDVALLASVLRDDLLVTSLRQLYLEPLTREPDQGKTARDTLRAYFIADHNVSSAAAALGVNRHTVASRLRFIEQQIGRSLLRCRAEMEAALDIDDLEQRLPNKPRSPLERVGKRLP